MPNGSANTSRSLWLAVEFEAFEMLGLDVLAQNLSKLFPVKEEMVQQNLPA
jgi:hypothetical protein